ncbi:MAG: hypothetical protein EA339_09850 [Rhodobacteraceae bacterium]|nr:MAG: hypothetical protein EA339_09850 [Paracoccaceae bacterium]
MTSNLITHAAQGDVPALIQAAKTSELQVTSSTHLQRLLPSLVIACETARVDTLRDMAARARKGQAKDRVHDAEGFSVLFAALRRVRAELKRRGVACEG